MFVKTYSDFSLSKAGVLSGASFGAHFQLDTNVSRLFPYINATFKDAKFYDKPDYVQFIIDGIQCNLYPIDVTAAPFTDRNQALAFAKRLIDLLNDIYIKKDSIKPDFKKISPVSVFDIFKLLPQTNCKECGYTTCMAFAAAISKSETTPDKCPDFRDRISESATYPIFDKQGNLEATISIEIDTTKRDINLEKQEKYIEKIEKKLIDLEQQHMALLGDNQNEVQTDLTGRELEVLGL